jgi:hypothetical protein
VRSNPALELNAPQPTKQNCADENNKQNSQLDLRSTPLATAEGTSTEGWWRKYLATARASAIQISARKAVFVMFAISFFGICWDDICDDRHSAPPIFLFCFPIRGTVVPGGVFFPPRLDESCAAELCEFAPKELASTEQAGWGPL